MEMLLNLNAISIDINMTTKRVSGVPWAEFELVRACLAEMISTPAIRTSAGDELLFHWGCVGRKGGGKGWGGG